MIGQCSFCAAYVWNQQFALDHNSSYIPGAIVSKLVSGKRNVHKCWLTAQRTKRALKKKKVWLGKLTVFDMTLMG